MKSGRKNPDIPASIKPFLRELGQEIGRALPKELGFVLLIFEFGEGKDNSMNYLSNARREDMIKALEELLNNLKLDFSKPHGKA